MGVLDQVIDLKSKGVPEEEIVSKLKEQGISPKEINDAFSQEKIKSAVSSSGNQTQEMEPSIMGPEKAEPLPTEGAAPSDVELTPPQTISRIPEAAQRRFGPMTQDVSEEEYVPEPQGEDSSYAPQPQYQQYQYQPQEYYPQQEYEYPTAGASDTDTMIEIAEQVFSEKIKVLQRQVEELNEFKTLTQTKIDNISDRLKRIEMSIDRLQAAILEKVGSYGRGLESVKKEMTMMRDSFGKVVGTLANKAEHKHHTVHHITHVSKSKPKPAKKKTVSKKKK